MISKYLKKKFDQYEKQESQFCRGMTRAVDLEAKFGATDWYRFYRWPDVEQIKCISMWGDCVAHGADSVRKHDAVTIEEAELIAAASAFWLMQHKRRLHFLESQQTVHIK
jgi:hypothetical protein